ncbi:MAG: hypothetical protein M0P57_10260 [Syntrophales bacterium]|nr:hypothetical protein [Syntrophales bacterium]MDY0044755.1 hypothetical protein [Syntrophales bacterium]
MFRISLSGIFLFSLLAVAGCQPQSMRYTELDANWGRSYSTALSSQILNPDAGENTEPVSGITGDMALKNLDRYTAATKAKPGSAASKMYITEGITAAPAKK